jgi:DNA replication and repair protein RecF
MVKLLALDIQDFRNIAQASFAPSPRATILVGRNGQGKTNLLEAIYLLATLKPLRAARLAELVRFGEPMAKVAADFDSPGGPRRIAVEVVSGGRTAYLDGKPQDRPEAYFDGLAAVCFSPDDLLLVKAGPEGRRRFLDRAAFNRWPAVLAEVREYLRALRARNAALRSGSEDVEVSFRAPLTRAGARLVLRRREVVGELAARLSQAYSEISGPASPEASLTYHPAAGLSATGSATEVEAALASVLEGRLSRDRDRGYTSAGPHMDDLSLALDGRAARVFASQGQQRALILALKIAEIENLRSAQGQPPLLLLDDVSSELDPDKNRYLLEYLARLSGQAFLTTTDHRLLQPAAGPDSLFVDVEQGRLSVRHS